MRAFPSVLVGYQVWQAYVVQKKFSSIDDQKFQEIQSVNFSGIERRTGGVCLYTELSLSIYKSWCGQVSVVARRNRFCACDLQLGIVLFTSLF